MGFLLDPRDCMRAQKENGDKELMKIELHELTDENMKQCFDLIVAKDQMQYIASNEESWNAA